MINKLAMNLVDYDPMAVAQRGIDTRRYTQWVWSRSHKEPIDEEQLCLFLTDERYGDMTEEQKAVARACRNQVRSAYGAATFRMIQFDEMMRLGMIPDFHTFREVLGPQSSDGGSNAQYISPRLDKRISADLRDFSGTDTGAAGEGNLTRFGGDSRGRKEKQDKDLASLPPPGLPHLPAVRAVSRVRRLASLRR